MEQFINNGKDIRTNFTGQGFEHMTRFIVELITEDSFLVQQYKDNIEENYHLYRRIDDLDYTYQQLKFKYSHEEYFKEQQELEESIKYQMNMQYSEMLYRVLHRYIIPIFTNIPTYEWSRDDERRPTQQYLMHLSSNNKKNIMDNYVELDKLNRRFKIKGKEYPE
tara:strand:- start:270 stop:764 length:495 start_codon:yes stop_codon:yes gene_type:complete